MNKELQDLAWASLPKETRGKLKEIMKSVDTGVYTTRVLNELFGHHNFASDTEPEEIPIPSNSGELKSEEADNQPNIEDSSIVSTDETKEETKDNMEEKDYPPYLDYPIEMQKKERLAVTLTDDELDGIIFDLIRIRDNRRESNRELAEILAKLRRKEGEE